LYTATEKHGFMSILLGFCSRHDNHIRCYRCTRNSRPCNYTINANKNIPRWVVKESNRFPGSPLIYYLYVYTHTNCTWLCKTYPVQHVIGAGSFCLVVIVYFKYRNCYIRKNFNTCNTQNNVYINDILFVYQQFKIQEQRQ